MMDTLLNKYHMENPSDLAAWQAQRPQIREALWSLLGDLPPAFTPEAQIAYTVQKDGYQLKKLLFANGLGAQVFAYLLLPDAVTQALPAVLYHHYHGNQYYLGKDELFLTRPDVPALGPALARAGAVVLAIDAYGFGERQNQGPAGKAETGFATELSLFKQFLWQGRTLLGMMIHDDLLALNYLLSRADVDSSRVAAMGMSLGGTRTTWLAALDERISAVVPVAQMTRYHDYAQQGEYQHHGIYYYVPAALRSGIDMEHLVSLVAPRPQLILIGDSDPLSPLAGVRHIKQFASRIYGFYDAAALLNVRLYEGIGHDFTPQMYAALRRFLGQNTGIER